ncbi:MAG: hypothetical protein WBP93_05335 [Pyrinomonadaceae bacterium]
MQKASKTKQARKGKSERDARAQQRAVLAQHISAILNNPATPSTLYNAIAEELTEWQNARDNDAANGWTTAPFIADTLAAYQRKEEARTKGGAR